MRRREKRISLIKTWLRFKMWPILLMKIISSCVKSCKKTQSMTVKSWGFLPKTSLRSTMRILQSHSTSQTPRHQNSNYKHFKSWHNKKQRKTFSQSYKICIKLFNHNTTNAYKKLSLKRMLKKTSLITWSLQKWSNW